MQNNKTKKTLTGATGAKNPVVTAHAIAFIKANGGLGNVAIQLTPNAINNGVIFGGGKLTKALLPNKQTGLFGGRATCLWACINGWANGKLISTTAPKKPQAIPLSQVQGASLSVKASLWANANTPQGGTTNQNVAVALLNGGFSNACPLYGTPMAKLVVLS